MLGRPRCPTFHREERDKRDVHNQDGHALLFVCRIKKVIFSACELGIFDLLTAPPCALTAQQVAVSCNASVGGTERLLDALVGMELLHVETQEDGTALYSNSEVASMYLAKGGAKSLHHVAIYRSQTGYQLWNNLADAVREGKNQYQKAFGIPPEEVFQAIYRSDKDMLKFMSLMNSCWVLDGHDVVMAFSLAGFRDIVDLGGDFFHDELPVADLYVLARIIHDWSEDKCVNLLKRICDVCRPGGGVLLVEATLLESRRGPVHTQLLSLNMLLQTEGRERPASQYAGLLRRSGFRDVQVCRTGKTYDAILALK
ncbi:acetylserotonin O-methyltransferase 2 isoform X3 [Syngnathoides biaculeatus]|uniref:acetylserotonin O-methyltransferase 2 isoform X3 n=1 Tax=Syngnathoides biaculeatus TaxID=300417 RepID=UPI002ADE4306|nr:acetylserotonin O-methyltransferase 2 isoform X3 [Syngnathoides biaculeatus]